MSGFDDEKAYDIQGLINTALQHKNNFYDFLDYSYLLFSSIDNQEVMDTIRGYIQDFPMRRRIEILNSFKEDSESKMNYFARDIHDTFDYDLDAEQYMVDVKLELFDLIGELINGLNEDNDIDI